MKKYSSPLSETYLASVSRDHRRNFGQFFTPNSIKTRCFQLLDSLDFFPKRILEPSFGSGEFIFNILEKYPKSRVFGYELDSTLFSQSLKLFSHLDSKLIKLRNEDTLLVPMKNDFFDLVIGNPPYFELSKLEAGIRREYTAKFSEIIKGRFNIYGLFLKRGIDALKPGGIICFVIPGSIKAAPSFSKLRDWVYLRCDVLFTEDVGGFSDDTSQDVIIFIAKKKAGNVEIGRDESSNRIPLSSLPISISTGNIVWNQHKEKLSDSEDDIPLIYSGNILDGKIVIKPGSQSSKKQYLKSTFSNLCKKGPFLLVSRTYSRKSGLKTALVETEDLYGLENHLNVIFGEISILRKVERILLSKPVQEYLSCNQGTLNLSKTQLMEIPIDIEKLNLE